MEKVPDGQYQLYSVSGDSIIRKDFFGKPVYNAVELEQ
jgi:pyruvate dehydrogenase complex dehydrogenase (E1) component